MILDILFIYCKLFPTRGGYRQGMHELLAPIVYVLGQDAINRTELNHDDITGTDEPMLQSLDAAYIEHDAYALFAQVMNSAQDFYEVKDGPPEQAASTPPDPQFREQTSAIVERSKFIHEVCLAKVDQELTTHLSNIEILPQIFLM